MPAELQVGLDRLLRDPSALRGKRLGLLANPASVTSGFVPAWRALPAAGLNLVRLFGPEHGFTGAAQDMEAVGSGGPPCLPIVSLYGTTFEDLTPRPDQLDGLDAVVCDLPDVGSRYYTFVWSIALMMKACAQRGLPVTVLDRPNPLGGVTMEGNLPEEPLLSFVGLYPVPVRHAMTPAEIAVHVNETFGLGCELHVVPLRKRSGVPSRAELGEPAAWVLPSPNMPTPDTALVYPGMCLVEGTNLSEGRGTTRPFELVGAPWLGSESAADIANALALPGVVFRPHSFKPTFQKHAGKLCGGVQLHVTDPAAFRSYETGLRLIKAFRDMAPSEFRWRTEVYEYRDDVPAIDLLAGTATYRQLVDGGEWLDGWIRTFDADLARFGAQRERHLLYPDRPAGPPAILVVGAHEAGKTTLAASLVAALTARGYRVGSVKHTDHEYDTDLAGKDSHRHAAAGANPAVLVAGRRAARHSVEEAPRVLEGFLARELAGADVAVVEGYKRAALPKIEVVRGAVERAPVAAEDPHLLAVVTDTETPHPAEVPRFRFDELERLLGLVVRTLGLEPK